MKPRALINLGIAKGEGLKRAQQACAAAAAQGIPKTDIRQRMIALIAAPSSHVDDKVFGAFARHLSEGTPTLMFDERETPAPWQQWGEDLDESSIDQMNAACRLPVAAAGALMPDAHVGYGLPIGGVLAVRNAVIPYAVGVDIACRMKLSVLDLPPNAIASQRDRLSNALEQQTRFGLGAKFDDPHDHEVMDGPWDQHVVTQRLKDKAWSQLGSSGSGNHFVEFGTLTLERAVSEDGFALAPGIYLALLSHSGSRGPGATIANHYSKLAMELHPEVPRALRQLAWLDLDTDEGQSYWDAMQLMGSYAAANHAVIHRQIARALRCDIVAGVENHHNFAWRERHHAIDSDRDVIVHRKGATPAGVGVLGVIPGSMADPGFVVRGRGCAASLHSASHGAGRIMSRRAARSSLTWSAARALLAERGVDVLSCGLDEVPMVYKDIHRVMQQQESLVEVLGRFDPRIVKMAKDGERAED